MLGKRAIPLGKWVPDNTFWNQDTVSEALNVIPQANGYRPLPALVGDGDALTNRVRGAMTFRKDDTDTETLAANKTKVYHRQSDLSWTDISGVVSLSTDASSGFITFAQYGDYAIILNGVDTPYKWDYAAATGNMAALGGSPPAARYAAVLFDFLILGHLDTEENAVQWCSVGNIEEWIPGTRLGDKQVFPDGGRVMGVFGGERVVVFQERKVRLGLFNPGSPETINFDVISEEIGNVSYRGAAQIGDVVFFIAHSGFHKVEGARVIPIADEATNRWFKDFSNSSRTSRAVCSINILEKLVIWSFFSSDMVAANVDEEYPDHSVMYHWPTKQWSHAAMGFDSPFDVSQTPLGLEDLDGIGTLEVLTESLDSGTYNNEVLGSQYSVFNSNSQMATMTGANLQADITLLRRQSAAPHRQLIEGLYPICDAANVQGALGARSTIDDTPVVTSYVSKETSGHIPFHSSARMHDIHLRIPAGDTWSFINGVYVDAEKDGEL